MKKIILFVSLLLISCYGYTQTYLSGSILSNTTWTTLGSPYIVTGDIVVFDGVALTIEPGVVVRFNLGTGIELRGTLSAIGNSIDSIKFTSNLAVPVQGSWNGITVIGTTNPLGVGNQVTMEYCIGEFADYFIDLDYAYHGPYIFRHCYFANNYQTNNDGGMPSTIFENCKFELNYQALHWCGFDSRVSNSYFINNTNGVTGIANVDSCYFSGNSGIALSPYGSAVRCTVVNNNIGVSCYFNGTNNVFINNNVSNNAIGIEMLTYFNGSITFTGNTICNNTIYNAKLLHTNNADLSFNCWCSSDSSYIRSTIYDGYVNNSYGIVSYMPLAGSCPLIGVGINSPTTANDLALTCNPNPSQGKFTITLNKTTDKILSIELYNVTGKIIFTKNKISNTGAETIDASAFSNGIYFAKVKTSSAVYQQKIILKE